MKIEIGKSYWHTRHNIKVWVKSVDRPCIYITEDVTGYLYIAFGAELEEIEE